MRKRLIAWTLLATFLTLPLLAGCTSGRAAGSSPLQRYRSLLDANPEYSIILEDMNRDGNFFRTHYHRYKLVAGSSSGAGGEGASDPCENLTYASEITDWQRVSEREYESLRPYLGMTLASKSCDGSVNTTPQPPGYRYVGDSRYGRWRDNGRGGSFWEFYGKYALMRDAFGLAGGLISRRDYNGYRQYSDSGRSYFGTGSRTFGTNGTVTQRSNPSFFQRRVQRQRTSQQRFSDKVRNRVQRSRSSSLRSRSSRGGK